MNYTDEEYMALEEAQANQCNGVVRKRISLDSPEMITSDNDATYCAFEYLVKLGKKLDLNLGFKSKIPYYEFEENNRKLKLYLNDDIVMQIMHWLESGVLNNSRLSLLDIKQIENEHHYILQRLKYDRERGAARRNQTSGEFKAIYPFGTINYGVLPYSSEQLVEQLNQL